MPENQHISRKIPVGRFARLYRLGALTSGVAGRLAVDSAVSMSRGQAPDLRRLLLTPANARQIANDLSRMRGAAMKLGQLLSMEADDLLPPELAEILARLRAAADSMPPRQLKVVLGDAWGADWRRAFQRFDARPIAAASIGQVHRARLHDGQELAIKVQYPGVAGSIDSDIANIGALLRLSGLLPREFDLGPYLAEARAQLHLEADYVQEARAILSYSQMLEGRDGFAMPEVLPTWSTGTVLAMSYLESVPIEALEGASQAERDEVMARLTALFLDEVFVFRQVQTDPNFANYRYCPQTGQIVLLDFGATRQFEPAFIEPVRNLICSGVSGDRLALEAAFETLGLLSPDSPVLFRETLIAMAEMVFAELRRDVFDFASTDLLARLRGLGLQLAAERRAPPSVPVDLLYLQRKAGGMFLLGSRLRARIEIAGLLAPHLETAG